VFGVDLDSRSVDDVRHLAATLAHFGHRFCRTKVTPAQIALAWPFAAKCDSKEATQLGDDELFSPEPHSMG
jgi:hypothetical protein